MVSQNINSNDILKRQLEQKKIKVDTDYTQARKQKEAYDSDMKTCTKEIAVYAEKIAKKKPEVDKVRVSVLVCAGYLLDTLDEGKVFQVY